MCDYSLEALKTTKAKQGETYRLEKFHLSKGFSNGKAVVCCEPGTMLALEGLRGNVRRDFDLPRNTTATFIQSPHGKYRDGLRFENGICISLQNLPVGMVAKVLMLPAAQVEDRDLVSPPPAPRRVPIYQRQFVASILSFFVV